MKMSISDMNMMLPKTFFKIAKRIGQMNGTQEKRKVTAQEMSNYIRD